MENPDKISINMIELKETYLILFEYKGAMKTIDSISEIFYQKYDELSKGTIDRLIEKYIITPFKELNIKIKNEGLFIIEKKDLPLPINIFKLKLETQFLMLDLELYTLNHEINFKLKMENIKLYNQLKRSNSG